MNKIRKAILAKLLGDMDCFYPCSLSDYVCARTVSIGNEAERIENAVVSRSPCKESGGTCDVEKCIEIFVEEMCNE